MAHKPIRQHVVAAGGRLSAGSMGTSDGSRDGNVGNHQQPAATPRQLGTLAELLRRLPAEPFDTALTLTPRVDRYAR
jgi:hypothetical protein